MARGKVVVRRRPIDDQLDRHWDHGLPNYSVFPFPIVERWAPSSIGQERFNREATPVRFSLSRLNYRLRDALKREHRILRRRLARGFPPEEGDML